MGAVRFSGAHPMSSWYVRVAAAASATSVRIKHIVLLDTLPAAYVGIVASCSACALLLGCAGPTSSLPRESPVESAPGLRYTAQHVIVVLEGVAASGEYTGRVLATR